MFTRAINLLRDLKMLAGLGGKTAINDRISVLTTKGHIKFTRNWSEFFAAKTKSKLGLLCVEQMIYKGVDGIEKLILPTHYKCSKTGALLPVENSSVWILQDEEVQPWKNRQKFKFPSFRIKFSDFWKLTPQPYSLPKFPPSFRKLSENFILKTAKSQKPWRYWLQASFQVFGKVAKKKFQVFGGKTSSAIGFMASFQVFDSSPPLHGGYKIPSMDGMEVSDFSASKIWTFFNNKI